MILAPSSEICHGLSIVTSFTLNIPFYYALKKKKMGKKLHTSLHFSINYVWSESSSVVSNSLQPQGLYSPWNSPGQNTGVGSLSLFQGIFPNQGLNSGLPCCRQILYQLSHKGSPRILEWVAYLFSSGSSWPRNQTRVSCIAEFSLPIELAGKHFLNYFK